MYVSEVGCDFRVIVAERGKRREGSGRREGLFSIIIVVPYGKFS